MTSGRTQVLSGVACALALMLLRSPACAAPGVSAPSHTSAAEAWDDVARAVLTAALREREPAVTAWDLEPLTAKRQLERLRSATPITGRVLQVGARSAISLRWANRSSETTVWYRVRGERDVVVVNRDAAPGSPLSPLDATQAARDVMALGCAALVETALLAGMRTRAPLRAGDAVCAEHIEPQPAVGRGERVTVHSQVGRVRVTASAIAEEDGAIGELLKVRAPVSRASYFARVTGRQEVRIDE